MIKEIVLEKIMEQKTPPGLELYEEYINTQTEAWMLEYLLKRCKKRNSLGIQRRTVRVIFDIGSPVRAYDKFENFCRELASQFVKDGLAEKDLNCCQVGGYDPGDGIGPHIDSPGELGESIITLNLGSGLALEFSLEQEKVEVFYPPRSLAVMRGASRYEYLHGISRRDYDLVDGVKISRKKRFGIVWWHRDPDQWHQIQRKVQESRQRLKETQLDLQKLKQQQEDLKRRLEDSKRYLEEIQTKEEGWH